MAELDAVVVGSGPNGLAAAITLAEAGHSVRVLEAARRSAAARARRADTPGFRHDVCSAIHPLAVASPFFATLPLAEHGLEWIEPPIPLAHPLDDGSAAMLDRSIEDDRGGARRRTRSAYRRCRAARPGRRGLFARPARAARACPRHPIAAGPVRPAGAPLRDRAGRVGSRRAARALFAGIAAHAILASRRRRRAAFGLMLGAARPRRTAGRCRGADRSAIADALAALAARRSAARSRPGGASLARGAAAGARRRCST